MVPAMKRALEGWWRSPLLRVWGLAATLFLAMAWRATERLPTWSEETSVHAGPGLQVYERDPANPSRLRLDTGCAAPSHPLVVHRRAVRPLASLCAEGREYPLLIAGYLSGVPYWPLQLARPLHHGRQVPLRRVGLLFAFATLAVVVALAGRAHGWEAALGAGLVTAAWPSFVVGSSIAIFYDMVPALCVGALALTLEPVLRESAPLEPTRLRALGAGLLVGASLAVNVKAVVWFGALAPVLWRWGLPWRRLRPGHLAWAALGVLLALAPTAAGTLLDGGVAVLQQLRNRSQNAQSPVVLSRAVAELGNVLVYWSDVGTYGDMLFRRRPELPLGTMALCAAVWLYATAELVRFLWRRGGSPLVASCAAVLWGHVLLVALVYRQFGANYAPLTALFGVLLGLAAWRASRVLGRGSLGALAVALLGFVALGNFHALRRGDERVHFQAVQNLTAQQALAQYLRAHREGGLRTLNPAYNLSGVPEALAGEPLGVAQVYPLFVGVCGRSAPGCAEPVWRALLAAEPGEVRVLHLPRPSVVDERYAQLLLPALRAEVQAQGRELTLEASFHTAGGVPVIDLYRVRPARAP